MLSQSDMNVLYMRAERMSDAELDQALAFADAEQEYRQSHPREYDTAKVDAWITAIRLEQARRAGKLFTLTDADEPELTARWPQLTAFADTLRKQGLEVQVRIDEINNDLLRVNLQVSGDQEVIDSLVERLKAVELPGDSKVIVRNAGFERVGGKS